MSYIKRIMAMGIMVVALGVMPIQAMAANYTSVTLTDHTDIKVYTDTLPVIEKEGELCTITISESDAGSLTAESSKAKRTITLSLKGTSYEFKSSNVDMTLSGGFSGLKNVKTEYGITDNEEDKQLLNITLPYDEDITRVGRIIIKGLEVISDKVTPGTLKMGISGYDGEEEVIKVATLKEYGAGLITDNKKPIYLVAGNKGEISFSVEEGMPNSLISGRTLEFTLDQGYFEVDNKTGEIKVGIVRLNGANITNKAKISPIVEDNHTIGFEFEIPNLDSSISNQIDFENFNIYTDVTASGNVNLILGGRGIENEDQLTVAALSRPVTIKAEGIAAAVGVNGQVGGKVTIAENGQNMLNKGIIRLEFEMYDGMKFRGTPTVEVIKGNAEIKVLGWSSSEPNVFEIRVTDTSSEASTIEISDFRLNVGEFVPDGSFKLTVGGDAIAEEGTDKASVFDEFITTRLEESTSNNTNSGNATEEKLTTMFTVGEKEYTINGKTYEMDAEAYISNGRTMVPLRYAVAAAGVNNEDVKYSKGVITILGEQTIQMTIGKSLALVDHDRVYEMATEPVSLNGRTYVPISEIAKLMNLEVSWDKVNKVATFIKE